MKANFIKKFSRGITALEFAFCILLISILIGTFLYRTFSVQIQLEKIAVQQVVNAIQFHLRLLTMTQDQSENKIKTRLQNCFNPMAELEIPPSNYLGALSYPDLKKNGWRQLVF